MSHFTTVRTDLERMSEAISDLRHDHGFGYHQIAAWAERLAITQALNEAQGIKLKAARSLGLNRVTLDRKIEEFGLLIERGIGVCNVDHEPLAQLIAI